MNTWGPRTNLDAYAEVESFANYRTNTELEAYRLERLRKYEPYVALFRALGVPPDGLHVIDVGAGSSAFLYALETAGLLSRGLGIEHSSTRHAFAERWRADSGFSHVENLCANFVDIPLEVGTFDCFSVLDDTYLYLRPENERYPEILVETARLALRPGGFLIFDFRNDFPLVSGMPAEGRSFEVDLPDTNAFASASYRQVPSDDRRTLVNQSTYVSRNGDVRTKVEITEVCDVAELAETLTASGFNPVRTYGGLDRSQFDVHLSPRAVVVATK